jgi:hypothetical protein
MYLAHLLVASALLLGETFAGYIPPGPKYRCPEDPRSIFPCQCLSGSDNGLRVLCELSGLAPMAAAFSNLASQPLTKLTISSGRFVNFFGDAMLNLNVTELRVEDTPIQTVDDIFLMGVNNSLTTVVFNGTRLAAFPTKAFELLGETKVGDFYSMSILYLAFLPFEELNSH